jgi:sterol desaturase/sphingolipid hydroxylase (fatty acid hydroxylase superfamily)
MHILADLPAPIQKLLGTVAFFAINEAQRYFILGGLFAVACWWWSKRPGRRSKLQAQSLPRGQIRRELLQSVVSIAIFAGIVPILFALGLKPYMRFYPRISDYGWPYFFCSILLMMLVQDTYFYWSHRLMHHRRLFRYFHLTHHRSLNPNPWSTYSVNPLEAVVDTGANIIILFTIPAHGLALFIFSWINTAYAIYGHLGYEILPPGTARHWLGRWINTSVAHNAHHAKARYNYGWYFLFWDRTMGTLEPEYELRYSKVAYPGVGRA